MRGSSWCLLADLEPILGLFRRSGEPILGKLGTSVGGFLEAEREKMVMLWKIGPT